MTDLQPQRTAMIRDSSAGGPTTLRLHATMADVAPPPIADMTSKPVTSVRRNAAAGLLAGFAILATMVVAAQFDPGRFVYVQPLRGAAAVCALIGAIPVVAAGAALLATRPQRAQALTLCVAVATVGAIVALVAYVPLTMVIEDDMDHHTSVVAASPDGTYEVVVAMRHGDSGDYQILRARSRNGVISRNAEYPLAFICDELVAVQFTRPDELQVVTRSIDEPGELTQGQVRIDPQTLCPTEQFNSCTGDQT